jgi:hypothetical protein
VVVAQRERCTTTETLTFSGSPNIARGYTCELGLASSPPRDDSLFFGWGFANFGANPPSNVFNKISTATVIFTLIRTSIVAICALLMLMHLAIAADHQTVAADLQGVVQKGKELVARNFKDPASAQWRSLYLMNGTTLCGEVNAKNSYGGYVGFRAFYVDTVTGSSGYDDPPGNSFFLNEWSNTCAESHIQDGQIISNGPRVDIDLR